MPQISLLVELECCDQANNFFFGHLVSSPQTVMGWTLDDPLAHKMAIWPGLGKDIHVLLLQAGRKNEVLPSTENSSRLRSLHVLSSAEGDEIGPLRNEVSQILAWREFCGSVHDDRDIPSVRNLRHSRQRQSSITHACQKEDCCGAVRESAFEFIGKGDVVVAGVDNPGSGDSERPIIVVSMQALNDDFIL